MQIKGIVFDFDGLIVDTEGPSLLAWQALYQSYNLEFRFDQWINIVGGSDGTFNPFIDLEKQTGQSIDIQQVMQFVHNHILDTIQHPEPLPGVMEIIHAARALGWKLAIASSSERDWVAPLLKRLGIDGCFEAVCTRTDVGKRKPDPAVYLLAVERIGLLPEETVALEDSRNGVLAAKAAGMYCVAIPNQVTSTLDFTAADLVLETLTGVSPQQLAAALPAQPKSIS